MIVKHPCMMVGQSVVPTLIHSGCDPGMLVSEKRKSYDYADDWDDNDADGCDLLCHCSQLL